MQSRPAGFWLRVAAFALDYLPTAIYLLLLFALTQWVLTPDWPTLLPSFYANPLSSQITSFMLVTLPVSLYFALSEASARQATWGKQKVGLRVTRSDSTPLSLGRALARTALKFTPWELSHTLLWRLIWVEPEGSPLIYGGYLLVLALIVGNVVSLLRSKTHQALYDRLVGSYVVRQ